MSAPRPPTDLRQHHERTDRNLLIGFFVVLFLVGGGLILAFYGGPAALLGLGCMAAGGVLTGLVLLIMFGLQKLSEWLDSRE